MKLSYREQEVAIYVAQGLKDTEISKKLGISMRRTGEIVASIKYKWNIKSRVKLAILAYHFGLVHLTSEMEVLPSENVQKENTLYRTNRTQ